MYTRNIFSDRLQRLFPSSKEGGACSPFYVSKGKLRSFIVTSPILYIASNSNVPIAALHVCLFRLDRKEHTYVAH